MKTILSLLKNDRDITLGDFAVVMRYSDGTIGARLLHSGLVCDAQKPTLAGLRRLLAWIDIERDTHPEIKL